MTYTPPKVTRYGDGRLDNEAWGFPQGVRTRRHKPFVLHCIHISGNSRTARMPVGVGSGTGTRAEVSYMARPRHFGTSNPDFGNSAHDYIARDGSRLTCIPTSTAGWNNGGLLRPNTKLATVRKIVSMNRRPDFNPNEAYVRETESTGYPGKYKLTPAQRETIAYLIAQDSIDWDIDISRETVHIHADLDSVNRANCPFSAASRETQLLAVIKRAKAIRKLLTAPAPLPEPDPDPNPDPCAVDKERLNVALGEVEALTARNAAMSAAVAKSIDLLDDFLPKA